MTDATASTAEAAAEKIVDAPIIVDPSNSADIIQQIIRNVVLVVGAVTAFIALARVHNFIGIVTWIQGSDFTGLIGAVAALTSVGLGIWKTVKRKAEMVIATAHAPDSVARFAKITSWFKWLGW
ncbi:MAG: hypothetical protein ACRYG4_00525 [Janthinobacterium lividum]